MSGLHDLNGGLVPVHGEGDAVHVLHLGGVAEHEGSFLHGGQAVDLGAADAVVGGGCNCMTPVRTRRDVQSARNSKNETGERGSTLGGSLATYRYLARRYYHAYSQSYTFASSPTRSHTAPESQSPSPPKSAGENARKARDRACKLCCEMGSGRARQDRDTHSCCSTPQGRRRGKIGGRS
jgi:hypothetical protein